MDTSAGAPPGGDTELVAAASEIVRTGGIAALKQLSDELDLLGSAAHQRVLAERPGFAEYSDYKWHAQSPVMWTALMREHRHPARPVARARGGSPCPTLGIVGDQDVMFLGPIGRDRGDGARRPPRRHPGRRALTAVREPAAWIAAIAEFLDALEPPGRGETSVAGGLLHEAGALDDDARDAAGGDEAVAVAHRHPEVEPSALDRLERRFGAHRDHPPRWVRGGRAGPGSRRWWCPRRARPRPRSRWLPRRG